MIRSYLFDFFLLIVPVIDDAINQNSQWLRGWVFCWTDARLEPTNESLGLIR